MELKQIIDPKLLLCQISTSSKKRLFERAAEQMGHGETELAKSIFDGLFARERLGTTGMGNGVAIPHCRLEGDLNPICAIVTLDSAIAFDAIDGEPVDLVVFLVVSGENQQQHLDMLGAVSKALVDEEFKQRVRSAASPQEMLAAVEAV